MTPDVSKRDPVRPKSHSGQEWDAIWDLVVDCMSRECTDRPNTLELVETLEAIRNPLPDVVS